MRIHKVCYIQLVENPMIHIMTDELDIGKYYYFNLRTGPVELRRDPARTDREGGRVSGCGDVR